jgi:hypothetical protein
LGKFEFFRVLIGFREWFSALARKGTATTMKGQEIFRVIATLVMGEEVQNNQSIFTNLVEKDTIQKKFDCSVGMEELKKQISNISRLVRKAQMKLNT